MTQTTSVLNEGSEVDWMYAAKKPVDLTQFGMHWIKC